MRFLEDESEVVLLFKMWVMSERSLQDTVLGFGLSDFMNGHNTF